MQRSTCFIGSKANFISDQSSRKLNKTWKVNTRSPPAFPCINYSAPVRGPTEKKTIEAETVSNFTHTPNFMSAETVAKFTSFFSSCRVRGQPFFFQGEGQGWAFLMSRIFFMSYSVKEFFLYKTPFTSCCRIFFTRTWLDRDIKRYQRYVFSVRTAQ